MKIETYTFLYTSIKTVSSKMNVHKSKEKGLSYTESHPNTTIVVSEVGNALVLF